MIHFSCMFLLFYSLVVFFDLSAASAPDLLWATLIQRWSSARSLVAFARSVFDLFHSCGNARCMTLTACLWFFHLHVTSDMFIFSVFLQGLLITCSRSLCLFFISFCFRGGLHFRNLHAGARVPQWKQVVRPLVKVAPFIGHVVKLFEVFCCIFSIWNICCCLIYV